MSLENGEEKKPNNRQNAEVSWELVAKYCSKYAALTVSETKNITGPTGLKHYTRMLCKLKHSCVKSAP